jgi:hypothetical protein
MVDTIGKHIKNAKAKERICQTQKEIHGGKYMIFKRYFVYARRSEKEFWTDWSQYWSEKDAINQSKIICDLGWQAMVYDRIKKEVLS